MSGAQVHLQARGPFTEDPSYTLFSSQYQEREVYVAESIEVPFDQQNPPFGSTASCTIPPKGDILRRLTLRSELPQLYTPLGPGYVYPYYNDQVDGNVFVLTNTQAIQPGDFIGYFNTQFLNYWATNFVGYANISVAYNSTLNKFVFTSPVYTNIFFKNENSASFWGFDIRSPDFFTSSGYFGYNFTGGTLTAPLTLVQAGWIRGFTPPPSVGFSYKDSVACRLVKEARLLIGGQTIDRLTAERLIVEDDLGIVYENQAALTILEGKNDTSAVYTPREYYTRLTFNMDFLSMSELYRQDVTVEVDLEKFENLPSNLITTNGFFDGGSWQVANLAQSYNYYSSNVSTQHVSSYKNYVITRHSPDNSYRIYNQDTNVWSKWTPVSPGYSSWGKFVVVGNTIYSTYSKYLIKADLDAILSNPNTPWTTSTYSYFADTPGTPWYSGGNNIETVLADARYLYFWHGCNYYIVNGYRTALLSGSLGGDQHTWTLNIIVFGVTPPLSASSNAAFDNLFSSYAGSYGSYSSSSNTQTVYNTTNTLYTWTAYYTAVQTSGNQYIPYRAIWPNIVYLRYDTYADFNSASSYTWTLGPNSLPLSVKDAFPGDYDNSQIPEVTYLFESSFDGRYIYTAQAQGPQGTGVLRQDTQNWSANTFTRGSQSTLSPFPIGNMIGFPFISDGRYTYVADILSSGNWYFTRYDNTKDINLQSSWEYYLDNSGFVRSWDYEFHIPIGFDGKYVYYMASDIRGTEVAYRITSIYMYDTTKSFTSSSSWKWLDFRRDGTVNASDGSHPNINLIIPQNFYTDQYDNKYYYVCPFYVAVGSRYVYFVENRVDTYWPHNNFIQFNPLTMTSSLATSLLVKYEKYTEPPKKPLSLYGQTYLNEFSLHANRVSETFTLRFVNPVRELWVTTDVPLARLVLRLNNEILIDDDQVTAKTIRAFEAHTSMPSTNVYVLSAALNPEMLSEPSGAINASRIATPTLEVFPVSVQSSETTLRVYAKVYNVLETYSGLGGLLFNSVL
jgi:hypothetical protein